MNMSLSVETNLYKVKTNLVLEIKILTFGEEGIWIDWEGSLSSVGRRFKDDGHSFFFLTHRLN